MWRWSLSFLVLSAIAAAISFAGVSPPAAGIARIAFVLFLLVFVVLSALAVTVGDRVTE